MTSGLATAIGLLMAENGVSVGTREAGGGGAAGEEPAGDLFGELPDAPMGIEPIPRGRGRPPGARNRSTEEWRQYLLGRYTSPAVALLEIISRTPRQLAEEWGLKRAIVVGSGETSCVKELPDIHKAVDVQMAARVALLPYLHAKAPAEIQIKQDGPRGVIVMGDLHVGGDGSDGLRLPDPANEADQQLIDARAHDVTDSRTDCDGRTDGDVHGDISDNKGLGHDDDAQAG